MEQSLFTMEIVIIISALARQLKCKSVRTNACTRHEEAPSLILQVEWLCSFSIANQSDIVSTLIRTNTTSFQVWLKMMIEMTYLAMASIVGIPWFLMMEPSCRLRLWGMAGDNKAECAAAGCGNCINCMWLRWGGWL